MRSLMLKVAYLACSAQVSRKLTFLYLANDVIQNSKRKGPEFTLDFAPVIVDAFKHVFSEGEEGCKKHLERVLSIWQERAVYENDLLEKLVVVLHGDKKAKKRPYEEIKVKDDDFPCQSSPANPPQTADLIRALQELENAASSDSALRQRISALPPEVQDSSLLHRITDKDSGERLSRLVEEACMLLADYSGRLAAEIDDRRQLTRLLALFLQSQRDGLAKNEQKLEEYKRKLAQVTQVRKELRSRLNNFPDLSRLPNVTGAHVRLPSSDKESGERLSRLVEEACMLLADYSRRLADEIDDRWQLTRLLALFLQSQRDGLAKNEQKLNRNGPERELLIMDKAAKMYTVTRE
ncbi:zinc transporter 8-like, partial [Clarias magur]